MKRISLTDNTIGKESVTYDRKEVADLYCITDKTIDQICKENEGVMLFPNNIEQSNDRIGQSHILNLINTDNPERVRIQTGNIMGFIGIGNTLVKIGSRFDCGRDDYFLHYMLRKVLSLNLIDFQYNNEREDVFDILVFMFPMCLKNALRQGLYKEYQHNKYNDAKIKGVLDAGRHISRNQPFIGNIAYSAREYSYDNSLTQLIRHAIEFISTKEIGNSILSVDNEMSDDVRLILGNTKSYCRNSRSSIINSNLRSKVHPFFTEYNALRNLCIQILRFDEVKYGYDDDNICGILFDGAWLWEEYVNKILSKYHFVHPENRLRKNGIYLFEDVREDKKTHRSGLRFPDFYNTGEEMVLDAKYKRLENYEKVSKVDRDDVHQIISYMTNLKATVGGFVAPLSHRQGIIPTSRLKQSDSRISIFGIEIGKEHYSFTSFCNEMKQNEMRFIESLGLHSS